MSKLLPLTVSGNEITDATRVAGTQGDGLTPPAGFGVWEATTNLCTNGGLETNKTGYTDVSATLSRVTSSAKFGSASGQVVTANVQANEGEYITFVASGSVAHTLAAWVWRESGSGGTVRVRIASNTGTTITAGSASAALSVTPRQITVTSSALTNGTTYRAYIETDVQQALTFNFDGVQPEPKPYATPYVETNGATASRSAARVQAQASLLNATQFWFAIRVNVSAGLGANVLDAFRWDDGGSNFYTIFIDNGPVRLTMQRGNGVADTVTVPATVTAGTHTLIGFATATQIGLSLDGAAFTKANSTHLPAGLASLFDIGTESFLGQWLNGRALWAACGTGTLTDADAATINGYGDTAPTKGQLPVAAKATLVWDSLTADADGPIYWVNPATTDTPYDGQTALKTWLTAGGRRHKGYLIKVSLTDAIKKTIVGFVGGN